MGTAGTDWGPSPRLSSRLRIAHPGVGPSCLGSCDCNQSIGQFTGSAGGAPGRRFFFKMAPGGFWRTLKQALKTPFITPGLLSLCIVPGHV